MIIKTTDFTLDAFIPNRDDAPNSDILGNETELQGFIDKYETEALILVLGYDMYKQLISEFEANGDWKSTTDQKWKDLVDGDNAYKGMKEMLIGYVFYKFAESDDSHYATVGTEKEKSETSVRVEMRPKAIQNYNKFYNDAVGTYYDYPVVRGVGSIFGNLTSVSYVNDGRNKNRISLYEYVLSRIEDFTNWSPANLKSQNYFDI